MLIWPGTQLPSRTHTYLHHRDSPLRQAHHLTFSEQVAKRVIGRRALGITTLPLWNRLPVTVCTCKWDCYTFTVTSVNVINVTATSVIVTSVSVTSVVAISVIATSVTVTV